MQVLPYVPFFGPQKSWSADRDSVDIVWEDMATTNQNHASTESPVKAPTPASVTRYNASLASKASPIPKAGNYSKSFGGTTSGYTYATTTSPLKPISTIPHPPYPQTTSTGSNPERDFPATPDDPGSELPASQIPDLTIGVGWNSAKKRAMARKRREVMMKALKGRTSDDSSSESSEDGGEEEEEITGDTGKSDPEIELIEAYEPASARRRRDVGKERSDDFDSDGIAWGQVDVDAIEASASQATARTPGNARTAARDPVRTGGSARATFMDRLKAVNQESSTDDGPTPKKRKREDQEDDGTPRDPLSASTFADGATTPFMSACGTLTPPETDRRSDLTAISSLTDTPHTAPSSGVNPSISTGGVAGGIHPLLEALNKDLIRRDRKAAADEKSREMLRGRVRALESRVRELEAELRKVKSGARG